MLIRACRKSNDKQTTEAHARGQSETDKAACHLLVRRNMSPTLYKFKNGRALQYRNASPWLHTLKKNGWGRPETTDGCAWLKPASFRAQRSFVKNCLYCLPFHFVFKGKLAAKTERVTRSKSRRTEAWRASSKRTALRRVTYT
jgi:hypothetical protein